MAVADFKSEGDFKISAINQVNVLLNDVQPEQFASLVDPAFLAHTLTALLATSGDECWHAQSRPRYVRGSRPERLLQCKGRTSAAYPGQDRKLLHRAQRSFCEFFSSTAFRYKTNLKCEVHVSIS